MCVGVMCPASSLSAMAPGNDPFDDAVEDHLIWFIGALHVDIKTVVEYPRSDVYSCLSTDACTACLGDAHGLGSWFRIASLA